MKGLHLGEIPICIIFLFLYCDMNPRTYSVTGRNENEIYPYLDNMNDFNDPSMILVTGGYFNRINEDGSKYRCYLSPFHVCKWKVTCKEYMEFYVDMAGYASEEELDQICPKFLPQNKIIKDFGITDSFLESYWVNPLNMDCPMVGITYKQAKMFCNWKNKKVLEMAVLTLDNFKIENGSMKYDNLLHKKEDTKTEENDSGNIDTVLRKVEVKIEEDPIEMKSKIDDTSNGNKGDNGVTNKNIYKILRLQPSLDDFKFREKKIKEKKDEEEKKKEREKKEKAIVSSYYENVIKMVPQYRLLTEAEWEFCASNATCMYEDGKLIASQDYDIYDKKSNLMPSLLFDLVVDGDDSFKPCPNDSLRWGVFTSTIAYPPNKLGIYGLIGSVYEMVEDEYHPRREVQTTTQFNPLYVSGGKTRTKKGASFRTHIKDVDIFDRKEIDEDEVDPETGFRLAMTPISVKIIRNR